MTQDQEAKLSQVLHVEINRTFRSVYRGEIRLLHQARVLAVESICLAVGRVEIFGGDHKLTSARGQAIENVSSVAMAKQQMQISSKNWTAPRRLLPSSHLLAPGLVWPSSPQGPAGVGKAKLRVSPQNHESTHVFWGDKISPKGTPSRLWKNGGEVSTKRCKKKVHRN